MYIISCSSNNTLLHKTRSMMSRHDTPSGMYDGTHQPASYQDTHKSILCMHQSGMCLRTHQPMLCMHQLGICQGTRCCTPVVHTPPSGTCHGTHQPMSCMLPSDTCREMHTPIFVHLPTRWVAAGWDTWGPSCNARRTPALGTPHWRPKSVWNPESPGPLHSSAHCGRGSPAQQQ